VQCVLVINIFNEKIFIFLWFWYCLLMVITACSLIEWLWLVFVPYSGRSFLENHLQLSEMPFDPEGGRLVASSTLIRTIAGSRPDMDRFINKYLHLDGVFILRMITAHTGFIFGTEMVLSLWRTFYGIEQKVGSVGGVDEPVRGRRCEC